MDAEGTSTSDELCDIVGTNITEEFDVIGTYFDVAAWFIRPIYPIN